MIDLDAAKRAVEKANSFLLARQGPDGSMRSGRE